MSRRNSSAADKKKVKKLISFDNVPETNDENTPINFDHLNSEITDDSIGALRQSEPHRKQSDVPRHTLSKQVNNIRKARKTAVNINTASLQKIHGGQSDTLDREEAPAVDELSMMLFAKLQRPSA